MNQILKTEKAVFKNIFLYIKIQLYNRSIQNQLYLHNYKNCLFF